MQAEIEVKFLHADHDAVPGPVTIAYRAEYDIPRKVAIGTCPRIAFDEPVPEWLQKVRRTGT